jgi:DNA-binding HxlR family transcriptional regulator
MEFKALGYIITFFAGVIASVIVNWYTRRLKNTQRLLILYMIQHAPEAQAHAKQIVELSNGLFNSSIFATLRDMENEDLLLHRREPAGNPNQEGRPYYYYSLTDKGLKLISPPEDIDPFPTSACT